MYPQPTSGAGRTGRHSASAVPSRRSAATATSWSVVSQNGGSERAQEPARTARWPAGSRAPRPRRGRSSVRTSRPAPWASSSAGVGRRHRHEAVAARVGDRLRPGPTSAGRPAAGTGSGRSPPAGRRRRARRPPARATACRTGRSPASARTPAPARPCASSPWQRIGTSRRSRIASAAASAARIDENSPSVRPPAAPTSAASSSSSSGDAPSRPGGGSVRGDVQDRLPRVVERRADVEAGPLAVRPSPVRPTWRATGSKRPAQLEGRAGQHDACARRTAPRAAARRPTAARP